MKTFTCALGICLLLTTAATRSGAQDQTDTDKSKQSAVGIGEGVGASVSVKATVQEIDKAKREVTLKKEDGSTVTIKCPQSVRNFDQIKEGDMVTARYTEAMAISVRKPGEPPSATGRESSERAAPGQKPGMEKSATVQMSATIEKIDKDKRELTLKGPEGKTKEVKVPESVKNFDELKEGDQIVVTATESLAINVTKAQE